ncbi:MAG TPA: chemotaxis protein CheR, partial [Actinobacteria bacterium]|nr:chemotaxis protein CheR [Actinomycetota bacterium]
MRNGADNQEACLNNPRRMSNKDFRLVGEFIQKEYGIKMPPIKKIMLESRLLKRLRELEIDSYEEYLEHVFSKDGIDTELINMIDVVTTNKTQFFREPDHFQFTTEHILPDLANHYDLGKKSKLLAWSAGCSTGEEVYSMAVVLSEFAKTSRGFDFMVFGTDVSTRVLKHAKLGIYEADKVDPVPDYLKKRYFLKSKDRSSGLVKVVPELRDKVKLRRLNLMNRDFGFSRPMHLIFCRNVIIYLLSDNLIHPSYRPLARHNSDPRQN